MTPLPKKLETQEISSSSNKSPFSSQNSPENSYRLFDPTDDKTWGFVIVDHTGRGPGLGGTRIANDISKQEISRLAYIMTHKNAAANLPLGGAKAGLIADPIFLHENTILKEELMALYADALFPIDSYIPAPDMGSDEQDMQIIFDSFSKKLGTSNHMRGAVSRPSETGGIPIDDWGLTACGLLAAAETLESLIENFSIKGSKVVIQGFGNVGSEIAIKLQKAGAVIVGASDINAGLWNPSGLNVFEMNSIRKMPNGLNNYSSETSENFSNKTKNRLLEAPCDILIPAARPDSITSKNADRIQCKYIIQGANTPSSKMTEYYLQNRKNILSLTDFIVNAGGVIGCAVELKMASDESYRQKLNTEGPRNYLEKLIDRTVSENVRDAYKIMNEKEKGDMIFREAAFILAETRLNKTDECFWV
jgi:glutamate dehydrogenase/leucine dehydrogenase